MERPSNSVHNITDHLFRSESGKMVAILTKIFGVENLEIAEDVIQETFLEAFQVWVFKGIPHNPSAWLFSVARNKALNIIKRNKFFVQTDFSEKDIRSEQSPFLFIDNFYQEELVKDDVLRMMFACCHPDISKENQIALILKLLCGFSTTEIAKALLISEDAVLKRIYRSKEFFREKKIKLIIPSDKEIKSRTEVVLSSIYLLFNEGYNSTNAVELIRKDFIDEAMMLCKLLTENKHTQQPETFALMALMCFHSSRSSSRLTTGGEIILLPDQDRRKWNFGLIAKGNEFMSKAAFGKIVSMFHLEAAIAFEHCTAESFETTNWKRILELFDWQNKISSSPITELNRAVAILQLYGANEALRAIERITDKKKIESYYLYNSLLGEIHSRLKHFTKATKYFQVAIEQTQSETEKNLLQNKIIALLT